MCISQELPTSSNEAYLDEIVSFLIELLHIQGGMLFNNIIVRGGVTIDLHYSSDRIIFSKGLVTAYELESKQAINPCILVDKWIVDKLYESHKKLKNVNLNFRRMESKLNTLLSLLVKQENGDYFLNYLSFWKEIDDCDDILAFFTKHKEIIENGAAENKHKLKVLDKYRWMLRYHNFYLKKYNLIENLDHKVFIKEEQVFGELNIPFLANETII